MNVHYGYLQFLPDLSSREAFNWGLVFVIEQPNHMLTVYTVYETQGMRVQMAVPTYTSKDHAYAVERLQRCIDGFAHRTLTPKQIHREINDALPLGHRLVRGGRDRVRESEWTEYVRDMYEYYVLRTRRERRCADRPYEL